MPAQATTSTMASSSITPQDLDIEQTSSDTSASSFTPLYSVADPDPELEFILFPILPIELRLRIWKLPKEPRVVEVVFQWDGRKNKHKFFVKTPLLHVCHESRVEGLKRYKRVFLNKWAANGVYFDFANDILYVESSWHPKKLDYFLNRQEGGDLGKVQRLSLQHSDPPAATTLSKFTAMNEFIVATHHQPWQTYPHPTGACPTKSLGLHDVDELIELNSDKTEIHGDFQSSKLSYAQYQMKNQEKFPDDVLLTHKTLCEPQVEERWHARNTCPADC